MGIYHYNARFYSPTLGRFLSADTIVPGHANPQSLNRYSYTFNNPIRYIDPSGHVPVIDEDENGNIIVDLSWRPGGGTGGGGNNDDDDDGGNGGQPLPMQSPNLDSSGNPQCSPNLPVCNPIFSGTLSEQELNTFSTNLNNLQSTLGYVSLGLVAKELIMKNLLIRVATSLLFFICLWLGFRAGLSGVFYSYGLIAPTASPIIHETPTLVLAAYIVLVTFLITLGGFIIYKIGLFTAEPANNKQIMKILSLSLIVGLISSLAYWSALQILAIIVLIIRM